MFVWEYSRICGQQRISKQCISKYPKLCSNLGPGPRLRRLKDDPGASLDAFENLFSDGIKTVKTVYMNSDAVPDTLVIQILSLTCFLEISVENFINAVKSIGTKAKKVSSLPDKANPLLFSMALWAMVN